MSDPTPDPFHAVDEASRYFPTPYEPLPRGMADFRELCTQPLREKIAELEGNLASADLGLSVGRTDLVKLNERIAELEAEVERLKKANEGLVKGLAMVVAAAMEEEG